MRIDLAAAELFSTLNDLWPFFGQNQLLAQMHVEDTIQEQVLLERERTKNILLTHIRLLERGGMYGRAAANHLTLIIKELDHGRDRDQEQEDSKQFFREADEAQEEFRRRSIGEGL